MRKTRREFLTKTTMGVAGVVGAGVAAGLRKGPVSSNPPAARTPGRILRSSRPERRRRLGRARPWDRK